MSDFGVFLLTIAGILLLLGLIAFFSWLTSLQEQHGSLPRAAVSSIKRYVAVNHYQDSVMSRSGNKPAIDPLSSQDGQNDGRTDSAPIGRAELLTLYKVLRRYGVPREEIRPALKGVRVPLSNDVWRDAAPPEPEQVTPIAGRPTDADFPYEPIGQ